MRARVASRWRSRLTSEGTHAPVPRFAAAREHLVVERFVQFAQRLQKSRAMFG